jgi:hypothetical protein
MNLEAFADPGPLCSGRNSEDKSGEKDKILFFLGQI